MTRLAVKKNQYNTRKYVLRTRLVAKNKKKQLELLDRVANYIMRKPFEMQDTEMQIKKDNE